MKKLFAITAVAATSVATGAYADAAWNFGSNGNSGADQDVSGVIAGAPGAATTAWTDVSGLAGTSTVGGVTVDWSSTGTWGGTSATVLDGDAAMMTTWLDAGAAVTLTDLTIGDTVYVYGSSDAGNGGRGLGWAIDGVDVTSVGSFSDPTSANGDYFYGHASLASGTDNPTYHSFVATATTHVISDHSAANGTLRSPIAGVQVVSIPEPGSLALLGLGGLAMIRRRRA